MSKMLQLIFLMIGTTAVFAFQTEKAFMNTHGYNAHEAEYYLTPKQIDYIRPGLNFEVQSWDINADGKLVVVLSMTDDRGQPLDRAGNVTPGPVSASFILAVYDAATNEYTAYTTRTATSSITGLTAIQASTDSRGSWREIELGLYEYTFGLTFPADADMSATHTIGIYGNRDTRDINDIRYIENVEYDFRPDGGAVTQSWGSTFTETCNNCHDPLALHGGQRQDPALCVTCHNAGTSDPDTGNTVDMKVMIHKIHMGENLPSVQAGTPYQIIGFGNSVHDYSEIVFPQDVRNCTKCHDPGAPNADVWFTRPSRKACGACHDDVNWETGANHDPGPQMDDSACADCHTPQGEFEFDVSIMGAHVIPTKSEQLAGLHAEILNVANTEPGMAPRVTFRLTNGDGSSVNPATMDRMRFLVGGGNSDYTQYFTQDAVDAEWDGDVAVKQFTNTIPADASGSWTMSADIYRNVSIQGNNESISVRETAFNPIYTFAVTDATPVARRQIISSDNCSRCHDQLSLHGGQRVNPQECVICHNPVNTDEEVRPEEDLPAQSIHFKWMIHRIHSGHELTQDFTVYGFRGSVHNYNEVGFPGDRRNCEACHVNDSYQLPLPSDALSTLTERDWFSPMGPTAAACLSCHDTIDAAAHAFVNTAPFGESCTACHGEGREFSVEKVHAR
ncbi:MAG: OmcA/MtrC family decaheme c-type cytochrome [Acidobacteria bacterium]|nr:OmcA/MtrC family decaheme c-type cytochrome [Acidobacteriota bacterium]